MNTSPIAASVPATATTGGKGQLASDAAHDVSFGNILSREMSDRQSSETTNPSSTKEAGSNSTKPAGRPEASSSTKSADDHRPKEAADTEAADKNSATDQILSIAAQFAPASPAVISDPALQIGTGQAPLLDEAAPLAPQSGQIANTIDPLAAQTAALASAKAQDTSGQQHPDFRLALNQAVKPDTDGKALPTNDLPAPDLSADELAEALKLSADKLPKIDLRAQSQQDARPDMSATLAPLQHAVANSAQAQAANASDRIAPHVGTPGWGQAVGQRIVWMIGNSQQSASITLNPPDLGPLQVVLNVSSTQANASFYAAQPEVRQALEAALPRLREMLGDAGIQLGQANVSAGTPDQQGSYTPQPSSAFRPGLIPEAANTAPSVTTAVRAIREGMVDTFA